MSGRNSFDQFETWADEPMCMTWAGRLSAAMPESMREAVETHCAEQGVSDNRALLGTDPDARPAGFEAFRKAMLTHKKTFGSFTLADFVFLADELDAPIWMAYRWIVRMGGRFETFDQRV